MRSILRAFAIILVLAAIVDPAIRSPRPIKPLLSIVVNDTVGDAQLAGRVARDIARRFSVVRAPFAGAAASVVIGTSLPSTANDLAAPVFAVVPEYAGPRVALEGVSAPLQSSVNARVPVRVRARVTNAVGRKVRLSLRWGDLVVDHVVRDIGSRDELIDASLLFVPASARTELLRVEAGIEGAPRIAASDLSLNVVDKRWTVLFFDRRPSWMSTFVRRALESDPRFVVASRVVTSRTISSSAGQPPDALTDPTALEPFDVLVTGSPESLSERDVAAFESFMRARGGSTVLLLDQTAIGPITRLTDVNQWGSAIGSGIVRIQTPARDSNGLQASEIAWPQRMPPGAQAIALSEVATRDTLPARPVVWWSPIGAGRMVVSGALDAWRFRESENAAFEKFWRTLIAESAEAALPPVTLTVASNIVRLGEKTEVTVTVRDAALAQLTAGRTTQTSVEALLESGAEPVAIRLWPTGPVGRLTGIVRAPSKAGTYRISANADGVRVFATLTVLDSVSVAAPDEREIVAAWTSARAGKTFSESELAGLVPALTQAVQPQTRIESWHPMRSPWWIIPFATALGGEWWLRRRRGLA